MADRFTIVDVSCCTKLNSFEFISDDGSKYHLSTVSVPVTFDPKYNLSSVAVDPEYSVAVDPKYKFFEYLDVGPMGGITNFVKALNSGTHSDKYYEPFDPLKKKNGTKLLKELNWIYGKFHTESIRGLVTYPLTKVKILPVMSRKIGESKIRKEFIIDRSFLPESATAAAESAIPAAAQPGGSLYDKKGKLLYRGEMKNGVPHGYGTGYYANGKVGHVGMFKGGKIVQ